MKLVKTQKCSSRMYAHMRFAVVIWWKYSTLDYVFYFHSNENYTKELFGVEFKFKHVLSEKFSYNYSF